MGNQGIYNYQNVNNTMGNQGSVYQKPAFTNTNQMSPGLNQHRMNANVRGSSFSPQNFTSPSKLNYHQTWQK